MFQKKLMSQFPENVETKGQVEEWTQIATHGQGSKK